jgi:hypothetical protein
MMPALIFFEWFVKTKMKTIFFFIFNHLRGERRVFVPPEQKEVSELVSGEKKTTQKRQHLGFVKKFFLFAQG